MFLFEDFGHRRKKKDVHMDRDWPMNRQQEDATYADDKDLTGNQICWDLNIGVLASRIVENKFTLFKRMWYSRSILYKLIDFPAYTLFLDCL